MIILHGLYGSSDNWVSIGKSLSRYFEVFIVDQRNHGRSPHSDHHNYELMRSDLFEFMGSQSIKKAILMGHSMGGKTVMAFASAYPEMVNGLVIIDIAPKSYLNIAGLSKQNVDHLSIIEALQKLNLPVITSRADADNQLSKYVKSERVRHFLLKNLYRTSGGGFAWKLNLEIIGKDLENIMGGTSGNDLVTADQITGFPVLFIRGAESNYILDSDLGLIRQIFPFAEVETIADAGHWIHAEQGEILVDKIIGFIFES